MIGRHHFREPLNVFMEKPVTDNTTQYMATEGVQSNSASALIIYQLKSLVHVSSSN